MHSLLQSYDYRAWLKQRAEDIKIEKPYFSYRYLGLHLGLDSALIARVFNGHVHLPIKHTQTIADLFGLNSREKEYFHELVQFCRARSDKVARQHFDRMAVIRGIEYRTVADDVAEFYEHWYHMALRSLFSIGNFKGYSSEKIGSCLIPPISGKQVDESIDLLLRLQLINKTADGDYIVCDGVVSTGEIWKTAAIKHYQKNLILMSSEALDRTSKSERDISSLTLPMNSKTLPILKDKLRDLRQELLAMSLDSIEPNVIFQLNLQLFPVGGIKPYEIRKEKVCQ